MTERTREGDDVFFPVGRDKPSVALGNIFKSAGNTIALLYILAFKE